jgi:aryl-alcohol dehydrogenase-like predicted oxidoreductase
MEKSTMATIKARPLGKTGVNVSRVGLGGEGVLRTFGKSTAAKAVIDEAVHQGITYFDSARAYAGLDLWQIHDVRTRDDIEAIEREGGALEVFVQAKEEGYVRHIGVTGHYDPEILTHAVEHWPVDTVLMPVNPVEGVIGGFLDKTLPAARKMGLGIIGMKALGASNYIYRELGITPERLIRFALSKPISVAIVGCSTPEEVQTLADVGGTAAKMTREEQDKLVALFKPFARQLAYYRGDL